MRRIIFSSLLAVVWGIVPGRAQFGNEWIRFNQEYFKISTAQDGLYRLSYTDLQNSGFPVSSVDPRRIQLFHRGEEQAIYIAGQGDGVFNTGDYLEFYGRRNDGTLDADLYGPGTQPNPYYNLFSDTTSYFLTVNFSSLGRRMTASNEINVTNIPKETYHYEENLLSLYEIYSAGRFESDYLTSSSFGEAEGWASSLIRNGQYRDFTLAGFTNAEAGGGLPRLELQLFGMGSMSHSIEIWVGSSISSLRLLTTQNFTGYTTAYVDQSLAWTDVGPGGNVVVRVQTIGVGGNSDRVSVSYIKVRAAQQFGAPITDNKFFRLRANASGKSYIEVPGYPAGAVLLDVTDPAAPVRIRTIETSTLNALIPNTSVERTLLLASAAITPTVTRTGFRAIDPARPDYVIISHRALMKPAAGYSDVVRAYGGYRASAAGGSYDTLVVDIDQLYNQFNYGEISPRAIRKFMEYLVNANVPDYLFIIGKGLDIGYAYYRSPSSPSFATIKSLVPPASFPGSDTYYTAGLAGTTYEPAVPTGRITALQPETVGAYLNKVKEMEALPYDALWRKKLLHLSGGVRESEPRIFKGYMEGFQAIAEADYLGGKVKAIAKQSTDIELVNISDEVNSGLNMVTFYGHASPANIDFDIGLVTDPVLGYDNKGKYPMFLINGCSAGSFFRRNTLFGENWINAENKGAVGFIAHASYGLASTLKRYSDYFYSIGYGDSVFIRQGVGDIQKEVARQYMETAPATVAHTSQVQQMLLLGDPAVKLFGAPQPDYALDETSLSIASFDGEPVTALSDSFAIHVIVRNYGITTEDTLHVRVTRTYSDGTSAVYDSLYRSVLYSDTLTFVIRKDQSTGFGTNTFYVQVDPNNNITELKEDNNAMSIEYFIPLNRTKNLYPYDYAIVSSTSVTLRFQTTDLFSASREFLVELDTLDTFDSPYKQTFTATGQVLAIQGVTLLSQDSLAYYWRTKLADPLPGESEEWVSSSFTYINDGPEGWAQIHFPQYLKNESVGLVKDPVLRRLGFEETETTVAIKNFGSASGMSNLDVSVQINGAEYQLRSTSVTDRVPCRSHTINLIAFDNVTTGPYAAIPFLFGDRRTCGREPQVICSFRLAELEISGAGIAEYIDNVPAGDSVVMFSIGDAGYTSWSAAVKSKLGELGISVAQIDALEAGEPVVIFARKDAVAGSAVVYKTSASPANEQTLQVNGTVTGRYSFGDMTSVLIGPAAEWQSAIYQREATEPSDEVRVDLIGIGPDGAATLLMQDLATTVSLASVDAEAYPYIRLNYYTADEVNLTATQLKKWLVLYTPVAEGLVFYRDQTEPVSLTEGESWTGSYGFTNISGKSFPDSLVVHLEVFNKTSYTGELAVTKIKAPAPGDTTVFSLAVQTAGKGGLNDVKVNVNPRIVPEQYYDNNVLTLADHLEVQSDEFRPVLEVTVDGRVIMDGDYTRPAPEIKVRLWDENRFILKTDTTGVTILLQYPCDSDTCLYQPVYFSRPDVAWQAATDTSDFTVLFNPQDLEEGTYTLRVQAADSRGNAAGSEPYEVTFVVRYDPSALLLPPYPNPSADNFVFRMIISGEQVPDYLNMRIYGTDGRLVREIVQQDRFFAGTNEIVWDGRTNDGADAPAGVYLYNLVVRDQGEDVAISIPSGFAFFRSGYGKVVLTR